MTTTEELERQARRHEAAGRFDRAARCYREAIDAKRAAPDGAVSPTLYLRLADLHFRGDRPAEAIACYDRAAERYFERGQVGNAVSVQEMSARLFPDRVDPDLAALRLHLRSHSRGEARRRLRRFLDPPASDGAEEERTALRPEQVAALEQTAADLDPAAAGALADLLEEAGWPEVAASVRPEGRGAPAEESRRVGGAPSTGGEGSRAPARPGASVRPDSGGEDDDVFDRLLRRNGDRDLPDELGERAELRRAIAVVDELLGDAPSDLGLVRRRLRYARRLGDVAQVERSLAELARALVDHGRLEEARRLYRRLLAGDPSGADGTRVPDALRQPSRQPPLRPRPAR